LKQKLGCETLVTSERKKKLFLYIRKIGAKKGKKKRPIEFYRLSAAR